MIFAKKCFIALMMIMGFGALGTEPGLVFHAPFDKDFSAKVNGKIMDGKHSQQVLFETLSILLQPGVAGKAALIGRPESNKASHHSITYPGENIINPDHGAISFWVSPQDWNAKDKKFHIFFESAGRDSFLVIYKYYDSSDLLFLFGAQKAKSKEEQPYTLAKTSISKWEM